MPESESRTSVTVTTSSNQKLCASSVANRSAAASTVSANSTFPWRPRTCEQLSLTDGTDVNCRKTVTAILESVTVGLPSTTRQGDVYYKRDLKLNEVGSVPVRQSR